jgi:peptide deformylase
VPDVPATPETGAAHPLAPQATWPTAALREHVLRLIDTAGSDPSGVVPIVQAGHPVLRMRAVPFDGQVDAAELVELVALMRRTMHAAPGVGLAAPQIGLPLALAVLADPGAGDSAAGVVRERPALPFRVLVNPRYAPVPGEDPETVRFYEGCLSVVGYQAVVPRLRRLRLTGWDAEGAALDEVVQGWPARIVQHETDHLDGTLYLDRALTRSLAATDDIGAHWASEPRPDEAARHLGF